MKFFKYSMVPALLVLPTVVGAQLQGTERIISSVDNIVGAYLIPIAFTLALLYFFWGVAKYIKSEGDGKAEGKNVMVWGVVALFVISSVWGLVRFFRQELGIDERNTINMPRINY